MGHIPKCSGFFLSALAGNTRNKKRGLTESILRSFHSRTLRGPLSPPSRPRIQPQGAVPDPRGGPCPCPGQMLPLPFPNLSRLPAGTCDLGHWNSLRTGGAGWVEGVSTFLPHRPGPVVQQDGRGIVASEPPPLATRLPPAGAPSLASSAGASCFTHSLTTFPWEHTLDQSMASGSLVPSPLLGEAHLGSPSSRSPS